MRRGTMALPRGVKLIHALVPPDPDQFWIGEESETREEMTHNYDRGEIPKGSRLLALISRDGESYTALGAVEKGGATSTFQNRVKFTHVTRISRVMFSDIITGVENRSRKHIEDRLHTNIGGFPPKSAEAVLDVIARRDATFATHLQAVVTDLNREPIVFSGRPRSWQIMADEKEAVDTALALGGLPHSKLTADDLKPAPILELLGSTALEDRLIEHDAAAFGGLDVIRTDLRGARVFHDDPSQTRVTVINANRSDLETTLGVDLIVFYARFDSYLLVQYKRLLQEKGQSGAEWRFRPSKDGSFATELSRILKVRDKLLGKALTAPHDYRLNDDPFYFKFCRSDVFTPDRSGMSRGLYVLAADVEHFLESEHSNGPRGGRYIGFDNYDRRFPNTLFLDLARAGWIGSRCLGSRQVEKIIRDALGASRSVTLANIRTSKTASSGGDEDLPFNVEGNHARG
jgi:hypothetical protein